MPNNEGPCEAWLWIQHFDAHSERLEDHVETFPPLREVQATCFTDPESTAVLVRLRFSGAQSDRMALRVWATMAGIEVRETHNWSKSRRGRLRRATALFECQARETSAVVKFSQRLTAAARMQRFPGPETGLFHAYREPRRATTEG